MNRRQFTGSLVAASAAPLLPIPTIAAKAAPAAAAGNFLPFTYAWATYHARKVGHCSPAILVEKFGITAEVAEAITSRMIKKGLLAAPNALGVSRAISAKASVAGTTQAASKSDIANKVRDVARDLIEEATDQEDTEEPEISVTHAGTTSDAGP